MKLKDRLLSGTFGLCSIEGDGVEGGGTPPAASTASEPQHQPTQTNEPDFDSKFEELFRFDPFAKGAEGSTPATTQAAPQAQAQPSAAPASAAPSAPTTQPQQQSAPQVSSPQQPQNNGADALAAAAHALQTATANLTKPAAEAPPEDPMLNYMYEVPQAVAQALTSEDPNIRVKATNAMHAVFARTVHQRVRQDVAQMIKTELPKLVTSMLSEHTRKQQIRSDLYGNYPELEDERIAPVIQNIAAKVMSQQGFTTWNRKVADKIAEEIFSLMPGIRRGTSQAPQAQQQIATQPQVTTPPALITNGSRPASNGAGLVDEITNTLFGDFGVH